MSGLPIYFGTVEDSVVIQDGSVTADKIKGHGQALELALSPSRSRQPDIQEVGNGKYLVNASNLRGHLKAFQLPDRPMGGNSGTNPCCGAGASATFAISIDPYGVASISSRHGDSVLFEPFGVALQSWRFTPFLVDGNPVGVTAFLTEIVNPDGSVHIIELQ